MGGVTFTPLATLLNAPLPISLLLTPSVFLILIATALVLGIVSGLYPAFYLSSIPPIAAFRGVQGSGQGGKGIRQALVLIQFVISISVIASTLLMLAQMRFVQDRALGFERDNRILVRVAGADLVNRLPTFMEEMSRVPGVLDVASTDDVPGQSTRLNALNIEDENGVLQQRSVSTLNFRPDVIETFGMRVVEGRSFDRNRVNDEGNTVLVNQSMVQAMGWANPLGKGVQGFDSEGEPPMLEVIGVVEDFHFEGMQHPIVPLIIFYQVPDFEEGDANRRRAYSERLIVATEDDSLQSVIQVLEQRWPQFDPEHPFGYSLLANDLNALYGSERRLMQLMGIFAGLCILISCLGLFGLSAFNTAQRTKEIGIRKVLGASTGGIILLLFRNILGLVAIAAAIASALSFWAVGRWLETFYYRIELLGPNLLLFAVAAFLATIVAFVTMALQSLKTAQASPILALRHE